MGRFDSLSVSISPAHRLKLPWGLGAPVISHCFAPLARRTYLKAVEGFSVEPFSQALLLGSQSPENALWPEGTDVPFSLE